VKIAASQVRRCFLLYFLILLLFFVETTVSTVTLNEGIVRIGNSLLTQFGLQTQEETNIWICKPMQANTYTIADDKSGCYFNPNVFNTEVSKYYRLSALDMHCHFEYS
jgi:hypothetical protein